MKKSARKYLRRFYHDTATRKPQMLRYVIDFISADRIMLASDYQQDRRDLKPVDFVEHVPRLSKLQHEIIPGKNEIELFRIRSTKPKQKYE